MKNFLKLSTSLTAVFLGSFLLAQAATTFYSNQVGTNPVNTYYLQTNGTVSTWAPVTASGSGTISTSSPLTSGQPLYATGWNTLASVASSTFLTSLGGITLGSLSGTYPIIYNNGAISTAMSSSTLTASSPLTGSFSQVGTGGSLGCTTASSGVAGCLSNTAFDTFNGKQNALGSLTGIIMGNAGSFYGTATSSPIQMSITGNAGAASALSPGANINGTAFTGASNITITAASSTLLADQNTFSVGTTTMVNGHYTGNLQVDGMFFAPVTLVTSGNTTINGDLAVTGQTTLATSLTGLLKATSGVVSVDSTAYLTGITADSPLSGAGTSASHLIFTNPGYITAITGGTCTNQFARAISTAGAVTCASVANTDLTNSTISGVALGSNLSSLSVSGSITGTSFNGSAAVSNWALNMANANTWTAVQTFGNASTTQFSSGTNTFYVDSTGHITAKDTVTGYTGVLSPTRTLVLSTGTTTAWTASTTGAYIPQAVVPFAGTIRNVKCHTDAGTLWADIYHTTTHLTLLSASTTVGTFSFSANNTVTAGEVIYLAAGTPASTPTLISCSLQITETP